MGEAEEKPGGIQVIARAATIMRLLGEYPEGLSLGVIAGHVGLARSTVQRIVQALEAEGFVEPSGPQGGVQLGPSLSQLVYRRQIDVVSEVRPFLEALRTELRETTALCRMTGDDVTTIDRCVAERALRVVFPLGTIPHAIEALAPGRALLSALPPARATEVLARKMSVPEAEATLDRIAAEARTGVSPDVDPLDPDLCGFAVPLPTYMGLHALAVILPISRAEGRKAEISAALNDCRARIERKIGLPGG